MYEANSFAKKICSEASRIIWNYNIRRNVNSGFPIVLGFTMRRVVIVFFEWGVVKNFMQKF